MIKDNNIRILVVDDEKTLCDLWHHVLHEEGCDVTTASTGGEALELFQKKPFQLVFVDLRLPDISGLDLIEKFKKESPDTELILVTAYASLDNAVAAIKHGVYDYIIKPVQDIQVIVNITRKVIEKFKLKQENQKLVSELKASNQNLEKVNRMLSDWAIKDGLTGLYNYRYFQESLIHEEEMARRYKRKFSVVMLDMDHFKNYNDLNGHLSGDKLLCDFANILESNLRKSDVAARYGGEEFVLVLPETPKEVARVLAEKIRSKVAEYPIMNRESQPMGHVTVSSGVATFPDDGEKGKAVVMQADQALYRAKNEGRNRVCVAGE